MTDVSIRALSKSFGRQAILKHIDLDIASGEFVALVGPSGCGKSTLLRMLAGLETISAGDLLIQGVRANGIPPQQRNIAMVFQSYALFPHLDVARNIGFGPAIRGDSAAVVKEKVHKAAGMLNLSALLERYPRQLSGGQRQRVAMGRSLVREPALFLFDEPLSNLDAQLRVQMRTEIKAMHQRLGCTIVYVTHDQIEAMTMADRIVVLHNGELQQVGKPLELYDRPANRFVASFIGSPCMNFLKGTVLRADDGAWFQIAGSGERLRLPDDCPAAAAAGAVEIGIRPEHFRIEDPCGPGARLQADVVEPTGPETWVYGRLGDNTVRLVARTRLAIRPGDALPVSVVPADIRLFDAATGLSLHGPAP